MALENEEGGYLSSLRQSPTIVGAHKVTWYADIMAGWNLPEPVGLHEPAEKAQFKVKNEISLDYDTSFCVVFLCLAIFDSASFPRTTYVA